MLGYQRLFTSTAYTNTTTTASTIGGLSAALTAGGLYRISAAGQWSVNSLTGTPTVAMLLASDGVLTATLLSYRFTLENNAVGTPTTSIYTAFAPGTLTSASPNAATTQYGWELTGHIRVNAAGTFNVQAKLNAGTGTLTIATGSVMLVEQIT